MQLLRSDEDRKLGLWLWVERERVRAKKCLTVSGKRAWLGSGNKVSEDKRKCKQIHLH